MSTVRTDPPTQAPEISSGINLVAGLLLVLFLARLWTTLDPQPGPLTAAVHRADAPAMDGYFLIGAAALAGIFALLRYAVSSALQAGAAQGPKGLFYLGAAIMLTLGCGFLTAYPCACLGIALVGAMGARWWTEAVYRGRATR
ncbi:hypothetical protein [Sinomonas atrocyanea]